MDSLKGFLVFVALIFLVGFVSAVSWDSNAYSVNYTAVEDSVYYHNLSKNITGYSNDVSFVIDTSGDQLLYWTNASGRESTSLSNINSWIGIRNISTGNLTINATKSNQTGFFEIPIKATNTTSEVAQTVYFNFIINATNDAPNFTLNNSYSVDYTNNFFEVNLTGSDEEEQYPLVYNYSIVNCSVASWSSRYNETGDDNCTLDYNLSNVSDTRSILNFTSFGYDDVGSYNFTICVRDTFDNESVPLYRDSAYDENKTRCYNSTLYIRSTLSINVSECNNSIFQEGQENTCNVTVYVVGEKNLLNITSDASLRNYPQGDSDIENSSWFYDARNVRASSFKYIAEINITPTKTEVGNWTINFTAIDLEEYKEPVEVTEQIYIYVNHTIEDSPVLSNLGNVTGSTNSPVLIEFNASDNDLLIPDKDLYDEDLIFSETITNLSSGLEVNLFDIDFVSTSENYSYAKIDFTPDDSMAGVYGVNVSVEDGQGNIDYDVFNLTILDNSAPLWNSSEYTFNLIVNSTFETTANFYLNLTDGYVSDAENDTIIFTNGSGFRSFNLTSSGLLNFTPWKYDVGVWSIAVTADDGYLTNSTTFNFNISNINSDPNIGEFKRTSTTISNGDSLEVNESEYAKISLRVHDDDLMITDSEILEGAYNESLSVDVNVTNLSFVEEVIDFNFSSIEEIAGFENSSYYNADFTPVKANVGNYSVVVNITDASGSSVSRQFFLNISEINNPPVLSSILNYTGTINDILSYDVNASDLEDGNDSLDGNLSFNLQNITNRAPNLTINDSTGEIDFNFDSNESYAGFWEYNVSVNDSEGRTDFQIFSLTIYGSPTITGVYNSNGFIFSENSSEVVNASVDYAVNNTLLNYTFYMDKIVYSNNTSYSYLPLEIKNTSLFNWDSGNYSFNLSLDFSDETYGMLKNLTLVVFNPSYPGLNHSYNVKVNVSHTNYPVFFNGSISNSQATNNQVIEIDLKDYFSDLDNDDPYYNQDINFTLNSNESTSLIVPYSTISSDWILNVSTKGKSVAEDLYVLAEEGLNNVTSNNFTIEFTEPETETITVTKTVSGGGGGGSSIKHYSIKIIAPKDVIIDKNNMIHVPFSIQNNGQLDLKGISLSSIINYQGTFSEDVSIELSQGNIDYLKYGESRDFVMTIRANTQASGRYKATLFANVSSPKFSDWADFYIELRKTNESEAEQILVFTEKLVAENPVCLELTETVKEAREVFEQGNHERAANLAREAVEACQNAINSNEQISSENPFVRESFYYISFATLTIFVFGFIFYIYKRVKFNKVKVSSI